MRKNIVFGFGFGLLLWGSTAGAVVTPTIEQPGPLLTAVTATATTINAGVAASSTAITKAVDASATKIETAIAASATKIQAAVDASATKIEAAIAVGATTIDASVDASATKVQAAVDASATKIQVAVAASATKIETGVAASATKIEAAIIGNNKPGATVFIFAFDGVNFFALRGDTTNGLDVDVTRVQGSISIAHTLTVTGTVSMSNTAMGMQILGPRLITGQLEVVGVTRVGSASPFAAAVYPMGSWVADAQTTSVFVGTSAVPVFTLAAPTETAHMVFRNNSNTNTVYLGSSGVTAASGIPVYPLEAFTMDSTSSRGLNWYAIVPTGSADLRIGRW